MADSEHPLPLRPGPPSNSPPANQEQQTSIPQPQQQSFRGLSLDPSLIHSQVLDFSPQDDFLSPGQSMPPTQSGQQASHSARFPSTHFHSNESYGESSMAAQSYQQSGHQASNEGGSRPRSSTYGQSYVTSVQAPPMPAPLASHAQPLFAQHSGMTSGMPSTAQATSRSQQPQTPPASAFQNGPLLSQSATVPARPSSGQVTTNNGRSPFTTAIAAPPRNKPNQLLIINPTSTTALTNALLTTLRPNLPHALEVTAYTSSYPSPTAVESTTDMVLSAETTLRDLAKHSTNNGETIQNFDGLLVCNFGKHSLIDALRESYDVPVVGIMEASLYVARMLGVRFGIVIASARAKVAIDDAVTAYGLSHFFVGVEALHVNSLDLCEQASATPTSSGPPSVTQPTQQPTPQSLSQRSKEEITKRITLASRNLVARGADTVIIGSEFLSSNDHIRVIKDAVRDEDGRRTVNVVDAVEAGVMMLNGLVGMGIPTSKKGFYRSEREGRRGRGQGWL